MAMSRSLAGTWLTMRPSIETVPDEIELEPGDHAQRRRLAAARRPQQHHELAVRDVERHIVGGWRVPAVVDLGELVDCDDGHQRFPIISRRPPSCPG